VREAWGEGIPQNWSSDFGCSVSSDRVHQLRLPHLLPGSCIGPAVTIITAHETCRVMRCAKSNSPATEVIRRLRLRLSFRQPVELYSLGERIDRCDPGHRCELGADQPKSIKECSNSGNCTMRSNRKPSFWRRWIETPLEREVTAMIRGKCRVSRP
jgi:hypothetical protein